MTIKITQTCYTNLYELKIPNIHVTPQDQKKNVINVGSEETPDINEEEIQHALRTMKNHKAPG